MGQSEFISTADLLLAYGLLRLILGVNIAVHGVSRINLGVRSFAQGLVPLSASTPLSPRAVYAYATALPFTETAIGFLVFFGLESRYAYVLGLLLILSLTFGATLRQDWESAGLQLVYALTYAVLLALREYNSFSVDGWMAAIRQIGRTP